jgi:hypothetical protein
MAKNQLTRHTLPRDCAPGKGVPLPVDAWPPWRARGGLARSGGRQCQLGMSAPSVPSTGVGVPPPDGSIQIPAPLPPPILVNAISVPSGDQVGSIAPPQPAGVMRVTLDPSECHQED